MISIIKISVFLSPIVLYLYDLMLTVVNVKKKVVYTGKRSDTVPPVY